MLSTASSREKVAQTSLPHFLSVADFRSRTGMSWNAMAIKTGLNADTLRRYAAPPTAKRHLETPYSLLISLADQYARMVYEKRL